MTEEMPLVSVVTTCYNSAEFIESCIQSVLIQDYPRIEHVIQDGSSDDGTVEILRRYDDQLNWVSEPDEGQAEGLDRALKRSRGDVIIVLNADDELLPPAASWAVDNLASYPEVAVVYGDQYCIDDKGEIIAEEPGPEPYDFEKMLCVEQILPAQAAFIRRSSFEMVGLYADTSLKTCPDYEMWVRIGMRYPMLHVPGFVARYRHHLGSEGYKTEVIIDMHKSKRLVMDRLFGDPSTPDKIMKLQRRAYAGVMSWAGYMFFNCGRRWKGLSYSLEAFLLYPGAVQVRKLSLYLLRLFAPPLYRRVHEGLLRRRRMERDEESGRK